MDYSLLTALQKMLYSSRALLLIARKVANIVEFQFDGQGLLYNRQPTASLYSHIEQKKNIIALSKKNDSISFQHLMKRVRLDEFEYCNPWHILYINNKEKQTFFSWKINGRNKYYCFAPKINTKLYLGSCCYTLCMFLTEVWV